jgi:hypothetical protein
MGGQPPSPPRTSHTGAIVAVAVVVVILVVIVALYVAGVFTSGTLPGSSPPPVTVDITDVNWVLSGASCSGDASQSTSAGETVNGGATITASEDLVNTALFGSCTFSTPAVTAGFTIVSSNAPVTVDAGGSQSLDMQIMVPSTSYTGVLTVTLTVTTA